MITMTHPEQIYLDFLQTILDQGIDRSDRTQTGTRSLFGMDMRFDLALGFPLLTTKKMAIKCIVAELMWFLSGSTNIRSLQQQGVRIWDEWADEHGELGPVYGHQWRAWPTADGQTIDQIHQLILALKTNPHSRRHIVSAWNVAELDKMALPPCHLLFQFYVANQRLSCKLTQRSADAFLGVPFNIASYALLTHMIAQQCGLGVGQLIWSGGDCHIYHNHIEAVKTQLTRTPYPWPTLAIQRTPESIFDYQLGDFEFEHYQSHARISAPISV